MHLKKIVLFPCIILSLIGYGQDKKFNFSLDYSYGSSFRRISGNQHLVSIRDSEVPIGTHGVNFQIKYNLAERLGIVSGLGYNQYGEEARFQPIFGNTIDPRRGFVYQASSANPTYAKIKHIYDFLSIPVLLNYSILDREKSNLDIQMGGVINYLLEARTISELTYSDGQRNQESNNYDFESNDVNFTGLFGVYYQRKLGEKYFWKVGPQLNYFLTSISDSGSIEHFPYRSSIHVGFGF